MALSKSCMVVVILQPKSRPMGQGKKTSVQETALHISYKWSSGRMDALFIIGRIWTRKTDTRIHSTTIPGLFHPLDILLSFRLWDQKKWPSCRLYLLSADGSSIYGTKIFKYCTTFARTFRKVWILVLLPEWNQRKKYSFIIDFGSIQRGSALL